MTDETVEAVIDAPADDVWSLVKAFGEIDVWFPGLDSARLEGDVRVLAMGAMEIKEALLFADDDTRTLAYTITEGVPIESHRSTIHVEPDGDRSTVTWRVEVEPDSMGPLLSATYEQALVSLGEHFARGG